MARKKSIYVGPKLRRLRSELGLTQAAMAQDLAVSPSYIALIERNQRPVTADLLLRLGKTYRLDIGSLAGDEDGEVAARLRSTLRDPLFSGLGLTDMEIEDLSNNFPEAAEAILRVYTAYHEGQLALADKGGHESAQSDPVAETRRFLSARRNSFPVLDDACELLAKTVGGPEGFINHLAGHGLKVRQLPGSVMGGSARRFDFHRKQVLLNESLSRERFDFQLALQIAYLEFGDVISELLNEGRFETENAKRLARRELGNYGAGALLMPYRPFLKVAKAKRYDLEALSRQFHTSFEQVAHRLTTLQKPGQEGIPFFFIRVDAAGNVSKRLDGAGLPFVRHGGSCSLWSLHHAFRTPHKILTQWVEIPDGQRFFCIARTVTHGGGAYNAPSVDRAIVLGCAETYAQDLIYAQGRDLSSERPTPIGVSCRLCHRADCLARAEPPIGRTLLADDIRRTIAPYGLTDH